MSASGLESPRWARQRLASLGDEPRICYPRIPGVDASSLVAASVLIPICEIDGQMCAVFTKRPETMPEHSGEVSFPGGRREHGDADLLSTALRETEEEIGLAADDVDVFGALLTMPTVTGFQITAWVGEFDHPYDFSPNPREIDELFTAPLVELDDPDIHRTEERTWGDHSFDIHFFDYGDYVIWGATGYMLDVLLEFVKQKS